MVGGIDIAARSVVGTHRSPSRRNNPPSTSIEISSSMNSGLPWAAAGDSLTNLRGECGSSHQEIDQGHGRVVAEWIKSQGEAPRIPATNDPGARVWSCRRRRGGPR